MTIPIEPTSATVGTQPTIAGLLDQATGLLADSPWWVKAALAALGLAGMATPVIAGARISRRRRNTTGPLTAKDRRMFAAALGFGAFFWLAVMAVSSRGLINFGRHTLNWHDGWEYLVPLTLDGAALAFGVLAFRAISKGTNPDRAMRIVWLATAASAAINFGNEAGGTAGSMLGAGYLAFMSYLCMAMFHEFLHQFEDANGEGWIKRDNPKFGMRWLTWPTNTACAWFAWRNYPPVADTLATITNAVSHLETVRAAKRARLAERFATDERGPALPWQRINQLRQVVEEQAKRLDDYRADAEANCQSLAEHGAVVTELQTAHDNLAANAAALAADKQALTVALAAQEAAAAAAIAEKEFAYEEAAKAEQQLRELADKLAAANAHQQQLSAANADLAAKASKLPDPTDAIARKDSAPASKAAARANKADVSAVKAGSQAEETVRVLLAEYKRNPKRTNQEVAEAAAINVWTANRYMAQVKRMAAEPAPQQSELASPPMLPLPNPRTPATAGINGHSHAKEQTA